MCGELKISAASLALVTFASAILGVVTARSASFSVVTEPLRIATVVTASMASFWVWMEPSGMVFETWRFVRCEPSPQKTFDALEKVWAEVNTSSASLAFVTFLLRIPAVTTASAAIFWVWIAPSATLFAMFATKEYGVVKKGSRGSRSWPLTMTSM